MKNATYEFTAFGLTYDLSAYTSKEELAYQVWMDVWHETGENEGAANSAQKAAEAMWDKEV